MMRLCKIWFCACVILILLNSCDIKQPEGERFRIRRIELTGTEPYQDYWEKNMGIHSNVSTVYSYDVYMSNSRTDTVVHTYQFKQINTHGWTGRTVILSNGKIM